MSEEDERTETGICSVRTEQIDISFYEYILIFLDF